MAGSMTYEASILDTCAALKNTDNDFASQASSVLR